MAVTGGAADEAGSVEPRRPRPHRAVLAWLEGVADTDIHLSAVTLGKLQAGVEITRKQDAATAFVHDLVVVTRNVRDFDALGVAVLDPFAGR